MPDAGCGATCVCVCQVAVDFLLSKGVASRDQQEGEQQGGHGGASEAKVSQSVAATSNTWHFY